MPEIKRPRIPRGLKRDGAALWSYGFRPFFLGGAVWAVATMALWIAALAGAVSVGGDFGPALWHAHEMLFGFASAVLAGFLLTAIPNWTGSLPVSGWPLIGLFALWVAGRIGMTAADVIGSPLASALDMAFLPVLGGLCAREIVRGRKWNDLKVLAGVFAVSIGNIGFHLAFLAGHDMQVWLRGAVAGYLILVMIIGGRIVPSFTRNWMSQRQMHPLPVAYNRFDLSVIVLTLPAISIWVASPEQRHLMPFALFAMTLNALRLVRWRGIAVRNEGMLFILHLGYGFLPLGLLAIALAASGVILPVSAMHVLTVGVIAIMMLAVMTRATRGHTGRALTATRLTKLSYFSLIAAALARPLADLVPVPGIMEAAGLLWIAAFTLFLLEHGQMLVTQRRRLRADG